MRRNYSFLATISCMFLSDSEYDVEFKTGSEENAGTDANVYFQMMGEEGESQEIELKNKGNGYFNRGQLDRFRIRAKDVGRVSEYPGSGDRGYSLRCVRRQRVWFSADLVRNRVSILVSNRVWCLHCSLELGVFIWKKIILHHYR